MSAARRLRIGPQALQDLVAVAAAQAAPLFTLEQVDNALLEPRGGQELPIQGARHLRWRGHEDLAVAWEPGERSVVVWAAGSRDSIGPVAERRMRDTAAAADALDPGTLPPALERTVPGKRLVGFPGGDLHPVVHWLAGLRHTGGLPRPGVRRGDLEVIELGLGFHAAGLRLPDAALFVALDAGPGDSAFAEAAFEARGLVELLEKLRRLAARRP
jgi:hypothetical protein